MQEVPPGCITCFTRVSRNCLHPLQAYSTTIHLTCGNLGRSHNITAGKLKGTAQQACAVVPRFCCTLLQYAPSHQRDGPVLILGHVHQQNGDQTEGNANGSNYNTTLQGEKTLPTLCCIACALASPPSSKLLVLCSYFWLTIIIVLSLCFLASGV